MLSRDRRYPATRRCRGRLVAGGDVAAVRRSTWAMATRRCALGVNVAPGQQPEGGLLIGRQVAGVDDVLDVGEPLAAPHASLDVQPDRLDRVHESGPLAGVAEANPPREVLVADCELGVQVGGAVVGTAGVLRGRVLGGPARRERPLASVICACLRGAGGVAPGVGGVVCVGLRGRFSIRHGAQPAAGNAISAHTRVPTSRLTPQRRDRVSTRFSPKPPPCCKSGARRAIDPLLPRSSTSRRRTSAATCARTLTTASAGASAWRTLLATSSTTSNCASPSIVSVTCPAIQAPTGTRGRRRIKRGGQRQLERTGEIARYRAGRRSLPRGRRSGHLVRSHARPPSDLLDGPSARARPARISSDMAKKSALARHEIS